MRKIYYSILAGILATTLALSGCTSSTPGSSSTANIGSSGEATLPKVVKTNIGSEPDSLDPWQSAATDTEAIFHNVFEGLLIYDEKGALIPGLAESYTVSDDGLTYNFKLRKDATFHNGKAFTSADVLYTYNGLTGMNGEKAASSKFSSVEKFFAEDEYTFVVTLKGPSAAFLSLNIIPVLPEGYNEQSTHPIGTGPYKFVEYTPGQRIVLEKNADYYAKDRMASIERAEIYIMSDASSVVSALRSGQLDFASVSGENAKILEQDYTIYNSPQNMVQIFAMNNSIEPYSDVRVRQAINYAINKDEAIAGAFDGYATKLYSNFSPVMGVYYNDQLGSYYETNVDKAKQLLKEAGYENGFDMTITVSSIHTAHINTAQIFAQQLQKVGINAKIETIEWATWLDEVYGKAQYETTIVGLTGKLDPDSVLGRYETTYPKNFFKFSNARYDELILAARFEVDEAKRIDMYKECQEILTKEAAAVYVSDPNLTVACRSDLKGYTFYPVGFIDFSKLYYEA